MQLFTIGLWKLNPDGSKVTDESGNDIPTYSNNGHIMNFARVFTGFDTQFGRPNYEDTRDNRNFIDPMRMNAKYHDLYPKPDLDGNYLGDGYPLCTDTTSQRFLNQGSEYEFLGYSHSRKSLSLNGSSHLYFSLLPDGNF